MSRDENAAPKNSDNPSQIMNLREWSDPRVRTKHGEDAIQALTLTIFKLNNSDHTALKALSASLLFKALIIALFVFIDQLIEFYFL